MSGKIVEQNRRKKQPVIFERLDWAYSQPLTRALHTSVLVYLVRRADRDGVCWPTIDLISSDTKVCERTVKKAIKVLETCHLITVTRTKIPGKRRGRSGIKNRYHLHYTTTTTPDVVRTAEKLTTKVHQMPLGQKRPKCILSTTKVHQMPRKKDNEESLPCGVPNYSAPNADFRTEQKKDFYTPQNDHFESYVSTGTKGE